MEVTVNLGVEKQLEASFNGFKVISDQSKSSGGNESYPEPFDYFMVSTAMCAAFYIRSFCDQRDISTEGLEITQVDIKDPVEKYKRTIEIKVKLPVGFPEKYKKAVIAAANNCTVKKVISNNPEFDVSISQ